MAPPALWGLSTPQFDDGLPPSPLSQKMNVTARERLGALLSASAVTAAAAFVAWKLSALFAGREPTGDAAPAHLLEIRAIAESLAAGDLGMWVHGGNLGHPAGIFTPLLPKLIGAFIHMGGVDLIVAFKIALFVPLVLLPVTAWLGARAAGLSPARAALAAVFVAVSTSSSRYGIGITPIVSPGLYDEAWAILFLPLAIGFGVRFLLTGQAPRRAVGAALLSALCHPIVGACAAVFWALALLPAGRAGLRRGAFLVLAVGLAGAAQWLPALLSWDARGVFGPHYEFGDGGLVPTRLLELLTGDAVDAGRAPVLTSLAALGVLGVAWRASLRRVDGTAALLAAVVFTSLFLLVSPSLFWGTLPLGRAVALLQLSLCALAACGLADVVAAVAEAVVVPPIRQVVRGALAFIVISLLAITASSSAVQRRDIALTADRSPRLARAELDALIEYAQRVDPPARLGATGAIGPHWRQLPGLYAGWAPLWTAVGPAVSSSPNTAFSSRDDVLGDTAVTNTGLYLVRQDAPALHPRGQRRPAMSTMKHALYRVHGGGWFQPILIDEVIAGSTADFRARALTWWQNGEQRTGRHIAWRAPPPSTSSSTGAVRITKEERRPSSFSANVVAETTGPRPVMLKVSWSPLWHATLDGKEVPVLRVSPDVLAAEVPPGEHELVFSLRRPLWHALLWLLSPILVAASARAARRLRVPLA
jgi:hypothetical protein